MTDDPDPTDVPVALVTGSASGIGEAIARRLAAGGMRVAVHSRSGSREIGQQVAREIGGTYLAADLADPAQASALPGRVVDEHGRLDVLVNNAGISRPIPHDDLAAVTPEIWRELLDVNLIAPWLVITAALDHLRASPIGDDGRVGAGAADVERAGADAPRRTTRGRRRHGGRADQQLLHHR